MTDDITPQSQQLPKKDDKKPPSGNNRAPRKNAPNTRSASAGGPAQGAPRPSSRTSNKKVPSNPPTAPESGSDTTSRKGSDSKKSEQRNKNQPGSVGRPAAHRKAQPSASQGNRQASSKEQTPAKPSSASPAPVPSKEASDALSSLQRVIADLKTTSPVQPPSSTTNAFLNPMSGYTSNLPPNAPVFQPGAAAYPGTVDPKHRKAASLGASSVPNNFNSFSPHLGAMMEDAEEPGSASFEDGEIQENYYHQPGHQPRSQSQSFMAPRFAALAAQQDQGDAMANAGRPQLAPGFMFGARRRGNSNVPAGPPINEEDVGFQFPQQQQQNFQPEPPVHEQGHRKTDSGEITGIMAEQVNRIFYLLHTSWSA